MESEEETVEETAEEYILTDEELANETYVEEPLDLRHFAFLLTQRYKKSGATEFKDFHEQFIVLFGHSFPNLYGAEYGFKFKPQDYDNPQKLIEYGRYKEAQSEAERLERNDIEGRAKRAGKSVNQLLREERRARAEELARIYEPETPQQVAEKEKISIEIDNRKHSFFKNGYYRYFTKELERQNSVTATVDICVNLNWWKLGIMGQASDNLSYDEKEVIEKRALEDLLATLPSGSHTHRNFNFPRGRFECKVWMKVTQVALDQLYAHPLVSTLLHPELILLSPSGLQ